MPHAPVDPERATLYSAEELYDTASYAESLDARAYAWSRERHTRETARIRALHDFSIDEALDAWIEGRKPGTAASRARAASTSETSYDVSQAPRLAASMAPGPPPVATT